MFEIDQKARRLSDEEKEQYIEEGYITGLPVFSENAINDLHNWYDELSSKLPQDIDINKTLHFKSFWQNKIGYVSQNVILKDDTLLSNIAFNEKDLSNLDMDWINYIVGICGYSFYTTRSTVSDTHRIPPYLINEWHFA